MYRFRKKLQRTDVVFVAATPVASAARLHSSAVATLKVVVLAIPRAMFAPTPDTYFRQPCIEIVPGEDDSPAAPVSESTVTASRGVFILQSY